MINSNNDMNVEILNELVNFVFVKQNSFDSYFETLSKDIKEIRNVIKQNNIKYIKENEEIKFVSIEQMNKNNIEILFLYFEDYKYFDEYKELINKEYSNYKIQISLRKFNPNYDNLQNDSFFKEIKKIQNLELFESKVNKLKYRMLSDYVLTELLDHLKEDYKNLHKTEIIKNKNIKKIVCIYNNEMISYFDVLLNEDNNEIIEYHINENFKKKDLVIGRFVVYILDKINKNINIKIKLINDKNLQFFLDCGFLLTSEQLLLVK